MLKIEHTYHRILSYIKGVLTNRERHQLEKEMMQDVFDEEAFEGLTLLTGEELEGDMQMLFDRLHNKTSHKNRSKSGILYKIAASLVLFITLGTILYVIFKPSPPALISEQISPVVNTPTEVLSEEDEKNISESSDKAGKISGPEAPRRKVEPGGKSNTGIPAKNDRLEISTEVLTNENLQANEASQSLMAAASESVQQPNTRILTGKVVDIDGQSMPGINIYEKGFTDGTITGADGRFSIQVSGVRAQTPPEYKQYEKPAIQPADIENKAMTKTEDLIDLNDIVVNDVEPGEGNKRIGAISTFETEKTEPNQDIQIKYYKEPVPPGGSLKDFTRLLEESLEQSVLQEYPGRHTIELVFTVKTNGTITDARVINSVPGSVAEVCKRAILQSEAWQPATYDDQIIASQMMIRLVIDVK